MRMLLNVKIPHEKFNAAVKDGTIGQKMQRILAELKPEAVYFTEYQGHRGGDHDRERGRPLPNPVFFGALVPPV